MSNQSDRNSAFLALLDAIDRGDVATVEAFVYEGIDVNQHGTEEIDTPLRFAVEQENVPIVELLLQAGAEPEGFLMLVLRDLLAKKHNYALTQPFAEVAKLLISSGIDIDFRLDTDRTLLMEAALNDALDVVRLLVNGGADVNLVGRRGHFALMCAAHANSEDVFNFLAPFTSDELREKAEYNQ